MERRSARAFRSSASHKAGQWQDFVFSLAKGANPKKVEIRYENDSGDSGGDRNLYVQYIDVQGKRLEPTDGQYERTGKTTLTGQEALVWAGKLVFNTGTAVPPPSSGGGTSGGSGTSITVKASGDIGRRHPAAVRPLRQRPEGRRHHLGHRIPCHRPVADLHLHRAVGHHGA